MKVLQSLFLFICLLLASNTSAQTEVANQFDHAQLIKAGIEPESQFKLKPLSVGDIAPNFKAIDQQGEILSLSDLLKEGPVVLIFYRGYWCPVCKKYLSEFENNLHLLKRKGAKVLAVTPETVENIGKTIEKTSYSTHIVSDYDCEIMKAYGVVFQVTEKYQNKISTFLSADIAQANGHEEAVLPVPASYIIGQDGTIRYVHFNPNYKKRASIEDLLQYLD